MSKLSTKKRKWSNNTTSNRGSLVSNSNSSKSNLIYPSNIQGLATIAAKPINKNKPTHERKQRKTSPRQQQKTSPRQHLDDKMS